MSNHCLYKPKFDFLFLRIQIKRVCFFLKSLLKTSRTVSDISTLILFAPSFIRKYYFKKFNLDMVTKPDTLIVSNKSYSSVIDNLRINGVSALPSLSKSTLSLILERFPVPLTSSKRFIDNLQYSDTLLNKILTELSIIPIVSAYYRRPGFLREPPAFWFSNYELQTYCPLPSDIFHSDGFRQVSVMILLNKISESSVHMEYALRSHVEQQPTYMREFIIQSEVPKTYSIHSIVGSPGAAFIFDTEGLHRGVYPANGGARYMLHFNFHPGTYGLQSKQG
jgi:hypothetical protein